MPASSPSLNSQIPNQNQLAEEESSVSVAEKLRRMALLPDPTVNEGPLFAEVDIVANASALTTVIQVATVFYGTPARDKAERLLAEAASYGSQLVVFPDAFVGGYPHRPTFDVPGPEIDRLAAMAEKDNVTW